MRRRLFIGLLIGRKWYLDVLSSSIHIVSFGDIIGYIFIHSFIFIGKDESNKVSDTHNITATQLILIMIGEFLTICIIILTVRKAVEHHKRTKHSKIINGENTISYNALKDNGVHL